MQAPGEMDAVRLRRQRRTLAPGGSWGVGVEGFRYFGLRASGLLDLGA